MAKAARKKPAEDTVYPCTQLIMLIDDVTSVKRDSTRPSYYGRGGEIVGIITVHDSVLLVVCGWRYVYTTGGKTLERIRIIGETGFTFPVHVDLTNYLNKDAKVIVRKVDDDEQEEKPRPSYGAPTSTGNKKKKKSPF